MKTTLRFAAILLVIACLFSFSACQNKQLAAIGTSFDTLGLSGLLSAEDFFGKLLPLTSEGKALSVLLTDENKTETTAVKTNRNNTIGLKSTTAPDTGHYVRTQNSFYTEKALDGLALPGNINIGTTFADALKTLTDDAACADDFDPIAGSKTDMALIESDDARLIYRDMTKDETAVNYRFAYQLRYTDTVVDTSSTFKIETKRSLILSFDKDGDRPLLMIELVLETRYLPE